jgi:hypothetical protein
MLGEESAIFYHLELVDLRDKLSNITAHIS